MLTMLNPTTPPPQAKRDMETLLDLIGLLSDPAGFKERIEALGVATAAAHDAIDQAGKDRAAAAADRKKADTEIAELRAHHSKKIAEERTAHLAECSRTSRPISTSARKRSGNWKRPPQRPPRRRPI